MAQADLKWIPIFNKAGIEVTQFPPEERAKLVAKAESAWNAWAKDKEDKGLPGKDVLKFAIAKREEIIAKYAKK
jgi:hypothetical protein